jgi:hypothetical protein
MAEEVQANQKPEGGAASAVEAPAVSGKKAKKINRMSLKELNAKIEDIEKNKMTGSKYFKHLLQRKAESESPRQG